MDVRELDYELPEELIAQEPAPERDRARLMVLDRRSGTMEHRSISDLPELLPPSLFVVNDSKVIRARLFALKPSGGRIELLLLERLDSSEEGRSERWRALARNVKSLRVGMELTVEGSGWGSGSGSESGSGSGSVGGFFVRVLSIDAGEVEVELTGTHRVREALERFGHLPLPPYVRRPDHAGDADRYQTIFAAHEGSVAAPTAGLHFSPRLIEALESAGHEIARITLHVGAGTFAPVRTDRLDEHPMHEERYAISEDTAVAIARARASGRPVVAVGTTSVRTLESAAIAGHGELGPGSGRTRLLIQPPFRFLLTEALLTNFHLPRSTLLALVMAFAGIDSTRRAYREAIAARYRFFSYGDAMLVR